jgi:hypothetical protein
MQRQAAWGLLFAYAGRYTQLEVIRSKFFRKRFT